MDVKQAVAKAKDYLLNVFADEQISDIRLEEVEFDRLENAWLITLGLLRQQRMPGIVTALTGATAPVYKRDYKLVRMPDNENEVPSIKIRNLGGD